MDIRESPSDIQQPNHRIHRSTASACTMGRIPVLGPDHAALPFYRGSGHALFLCQTAGKREQPQKALFSHHHPFFHSVYPGDNCTGPSSELRPFEIGDLLQHPSGHSGRLFNRFDPPVEPQYQMADRGDYGAAAFVLGLNGMGAGSWLRGRTVDIRGESGHVS